MKKDLTVPAVLLALATLGYMLPTSIAIARNHKNAAPIAVVNLFLGWTMLGWVVAFAWAFLAGSEIPRVDPEERERRYAMGLRQAGVLDGPAGPPMRVKLGQAIEKARTRL
jgi:Superinfection immunity protein